MSKLTDALGVDLDQVRAELRVAGWERADVRGLEQWSPPAGDRHSHRPELHLVNLTDDLLAFATFEGRSFASVVVAIRARPTSAVSASSRRLVGAMGLFAESAAAFSELDLACADMYDVLERIHIGPLGRNLGEAILAVSDRLESFKLWLGVPADEELEIPSPGSGFASHADVLESCAKCRLLLDELQERTLMAAADTVLLEQPPAERGEA